MSLCKKETQSKIYLAEKPREGEPQQDFNVCGFGIARSNASNHFWSKENQKCMYSWIIHCVGCNGYRESDGGAYAIIKNKRREPTFMLNNSILFILCHKEGVAWEL